MSRMFCCVQGRQLLGRTTLRAHTHQWRLEDGLVDDHVLVAPAAAARVPRIGKVDDWPAARKNLGELSVHEEADITSIGRPEGMRRTVRSLQTLRGEAV